MISQLERLRKGAVALCVTGQLCACLHVWKSSFLAIISRGGKGPIKLCECWLICHFQLSSLFKSTCRLIAAGPPAPSFTAHQHHLPQAVRIGCGPGKKCFWAYGILNSRRPGQWRLANEKSGMFSRFSQRMDGKVRVGNVPRALK